MHRMKYIAVAAWPVSVALFSLAATLDIDPATRYNIYAFGVLTAIAASSATCIACFEPITRKVFTEEVRRSRAQFAQQVADALCDEMEAREGRQPVRRLH